MTSPPAASRDSSWRLIRVVLVLLVAAHHGCVQRHFLVGCSEEEGYVKHLPQVQAMEDDLVTDCPDVCSCYHTVDKDPAQDLVLHVDCSQRGLSDFPPDISRQAYTLDMSGNKLINITSLPRLSKLRELNLADNWLRHLDNRWVFEHSPNLQVLSLSENRLRSVQHGSFSGLTQLEELDLSMNILTSLDTHALAGLQSLKTLRLDRNQLYDFTRDWFMSLSSLIELHASRNHISVLESHVLDRLNHLQHIDLSQNALRLIHRDALVGLTNLKLLNLSSNTQLSTLPSHVFDKTILPRLDILLADDTNIQRLPPNAASNLSTTELSFSFMPRLRVIEKYAFINCTRLHTLQIHDNPQLIFMHPLAFSSLPSLKRLLIHNNGLIAVPGQIITSLPSLIDLQLHHNPLHCDCNSYWLRKELGAHANVKHYHTRQYAKEMLHESDANQTTLSSDKLSVNSNNSSQVTTSNKTKTTGVKNISPSIRKSFIREPDRVACFFPDTQQGHPSSEPMLQIALQYFSPTCLPSTLPLFPPIVNSTLGEDLVLECQGLGVPIPQISWLLPTGKKLNNSSSNVTAKKKKAPRMELIDDSRLTIKDIRISDAGVYRCTASNSLGQDASYVTVHVQNKPLDLLEVEVGYDFITISLVGNIPRMDLGHFQIYYINSEQYQFSTEGKNQDFQIDSKIGFSVIRLRAYGSLNRLIINKLKPHTTYKVCLVYKNSHAISCKTWTTANMLRVVRTRPGIVRISKTQVVFAVVGSLAAVVLLMLVITLVKRRTKASGGYHDSVGGRDEKASIPLDGLLLSRNNNSSLNSSRTALLSNSHV